MFNHATFGDKDIVLTSGTYDSSSNVGPLQTRTYVFNVMTDKLDGTYYPTFSLGFRDADSLYYLYAGKSGQYAPYVECHKQTGHIHRREKRTRSSSRLPTPGKTM